MERTKTTLCLAALLALCAPDASATDCNQNGVPDEIDLTPRMPAYDPWTSHAVGAPPAAIAATDLDGDGDADLAVACDPPGGVKVLLNQGGGSFSPPEPYPAETGIVYSDLAAGDMDGDARPDLCVISYLFRSLTLLRNAGAGTFEAWQRLTFEDRQPAAVELVDLDGDADRDIVIVTTYPENTGTLIVLLNDGRGGFTRLENFTTGRNHPRSLAVADLNQDGKPDIAVLHESSNSMAYGGDIGIYHQAPEAVGRLHSATVFPTLAGLMQDLITADLDADGSPELLVTHHVGANNTHVTVLRRAEDGSFVIARTHFAGTGGENAAASDLDLDGDADIAVSNGWILLNDGKEGLSTGLPFLQISRSRALGTADFDGDAMPDIAVARPEWFLFPDAVTVFHGQLEPVARDCNQNGIPDSCDAAAGDCNENGIPDACETAPGPAAFSPREQFPIAWYTEKQVLIEADFEADGDVDLAAISIDPAGVSIALNGGSGAFSELTNYTTEGIPISLATGDWDGDRFPDLAVGSTLLAGLSLFTSERDGTFLRGLDLRLGEDPIALAAGDMDADGDADILALTRAENEGALIPFYNDGRGSFFSGPRLRRTPMEQGRLLVADLNSDGSLDALAVSPGAHELLFYPNDGAGGFVSEEALAPSNEAIVDAAINDMDGDGDLDIGLLFRGRIRLLWNHGGRRFIPHGIPIGQMPAECLVLEDFDADGRPDIGLCAASSPCHILGTTVHVLFQSGRGAFSTPFAVLRLKGAAKVLVAGDLDGDARPDVAAATWVSIELAFGDPLKRALDCNSNRIPDECELDCDSSGVPDDCEIQSGIASDCNRNGVVDGCETECNGNSIPDECDIQDGTSRDCNLDGLPDECQLRWFDWNANGIPDDCDIADASSLDCNSNGVPDETDLAPSIQFMAPREVGFGRSHASALDFDADGDLDLAFLVEGKECAGQLGAAGVLWNDAGAFHRWSRQPVGILPTFLASGDFDGDRKLDLAVSCAKVAGDSSGSLWTVLSRSMEFLNFSTSVPIGFAPGPLASGDFDGDRDLDLASLEQDLGLARGKLVLMLNDGHGGFPSGRTIEDGPFRRSLVTADWNGDDLCDLALFTHGDRRVSFFFNAGGADFQGPVNLDLELRIDSFSQVDMDADLDVDLILELMFATESRFAILSNDGTGGFTSGEPFELATNAFSYAAADLDGDRLLDIVTSGTSLDSGFPNNTTMVSVIRNFGDGKLAAGGRYVVPGGSRVLGASRANAGGALDLHLDLGAARLYSMKGNGSGGFFIPKAFPVRVGASSIAAGDFNADGRMDFAIGSGFVLEILLNAADGSYSRSEIRLGVRPVSVAARDFNGDGLPDVATANSSGSGSVPDTISVVLNEGGGRFRERRNFAVGTGAFKVFAEDFNGDGTVDLVSVGNLPGDASFLRNRGDGVFLLPLSVPLNLPTSAAAAGDFDADGDLDLAISSHESWILHLNNSAGEFSEGHVFYLPVTPIAMAAADFDADGLTDLAVVGHDYRVGKLLIIFKNRRGGAFGQESLDVRRDFLGIKAAIHPGDFDGDGDIDLALSDTYTNVSILINAGLGSFSRGGAFGTGWPSSAMTAADADGDLDLDLAYVAPQGQLVLVENTSGPTSLDSNRDGAPDECGLAGSARFRRGDANADALVDVSDAAAILRLLFTGAVRLECDDSADADDDGAVKLTDAIVILLHLFAGRGPLPPPRGVCAIDPTPDDLGCEFPGPCS